MSIVVIDYGAGNIQSILNILDKLGKNYVVSSSFEDILSASKLIFPGQGSFAQAMENLSQKKMVEPIKLAIDKGIPFLGICLGLQILFEKSEEAPNVKGLGILKGEVKRFVKGKIPQIGWNKVFPCTSNSLLKEDFYYFVNSYYVIPEDKNIIYATSDYHGEFCCAIKKDNLLAVQFHPEKSAKFALELFVSWI